MTPVPMVGVPEMTLNFIVPELIESVLLLLSVEAS